MHNKSLNFFSRMNSPLQMPIPPHLVLMLMTLFFFPPIVGQSPAPQKKDIFLLLDNSGSMKQNDPSFLIRQAGEYLVNALDNQTRIGGYVFDEKIRELSPLIPVSDAQKKQQFINNLNKINYKGAFTNIPDAFERATYELKNNSDAATYKAIVFITDGYIDTGNKSQDTEKRKWLSQSLAADAHNSGIKIFGVAFTEDADFQLIQEVTTKTEGDYFKAFAAKDLKPTFEKIAQKIAAIPPKVQTTPTPSNTTSSPQSQTSSSEENGILLWLIIGVLILLAGFLFIRSFNSKSPQIHQHSLSTPPISEPQPKTSPASTIPHSRIPIPPAYLIDQSQASNEDKFYIEKELTSIGRKPENDIALVNANRTVTGYNHAHILFKNNRFYIKDLSSNYTKVNEKKLEKEKEVLLKHGDTISFVEYHFKFELDKNEEEGTVIGVFDSGSLEGGTIIVTNPDEPPIPPTNDDEQLGEDEDLGGTPTDDNKQDLQKKEAEDNQEIPTPPISNTSQPPTHLFPNCPNHSEIEATQWCKSCGGTFCKDCMAAEEICLQCLNQKDTV